MKRALFVIACAAASVVPVLGRPSAGPPAGFPGWPAEFEGLPLQEVPLTTVESSFSDGFPGRIARFSDGSREFVLRWVAEPTRRLHPAVDCFRGSGYTVRPLPSSAGWGCFEARRGRERLVVRERITDGAGGSWTEASAWFWAATLQRTPAPWWAVTVVERADRY